MFVVVCIATSLPPNESPDKKAKRANKQRRNHSKQIANPRNYGVIVAIHQHLRHNCEHANNRNGSNKHQV